MTPGQVAIEATQLSKAFAGRSILRQIDLSIAHGETVAVTGANGAGKTTLLRCLAGRIRPDAGVVHWQGHLARGNLRGRRLIGMAAHESRLYPHLTLRENLIFAARMYGLPAAKPTADAMLERVSLQAHAACYPGQISQGMRQRVALARVLLHDPPIILLDEPLAGLDTSGIDWLIGLLEELRGSQRTMCVASHRLTFLRELRTEWSVCGRGESSVFWKPRCRRGSGQVESSVPHDGSQRDDVKTLVARP